MGMQYIIIAEMSFENEADRDEWATAIRTAVVNAMPNKPDFLSARLRRLEQHILKEQQVETIEA